MSSAVVVPAFGHCLVPAAQEVVRVGRIAIGTSGQGKETMHGVEFVTVADSRDGKDVVQHEDFLRETMAATASRSEGWSPLTHAKKCPARHGTFQRPIDAATGFTQSAHPKFDKTALAASVLIVAGDGSVLVTQRKENMRAFPSFWVLPGGHVDPGEHIIASALREVREEVGDAIADAVASDGDLVKTVTAANEAFAAQTAPVPVPFYGVWESCYPIEPTEVVPARHHFVTFFCWRLPESAENPPVVLQEEECSNYAWVKPIWDEKRESCAFEGLPENALMAEGTKFMLRALYGASISGATPGTLTHVFSENEGGQ